MSSASCIIIDDEPKAIELLKESLGYLYPDLDIMGSYTSWQTALEALRTVSFDILFSDISMPGKNSMDILKLLPEIKCEIIFITAHSDYALHAFKFPTAGYILKPIDDAELKVAVDRAMERVNNKKLAKQNKNSLSLLDSKIGIPNGNGIDYLDVKDIIYLESVNKCTKVVTKDLEIISSYNIGKFKNLERHLFYQVHRSFMVNLNCIRRYEISGFIIMSNNKEIPIAKNERTQFQHLFGKITKSAVEKNNES